MIRTVLDSQVEKEEVEGGNGFHIDSDTFKPTGKILGNGCWGGVDLYRDSGGQEWAIKIFNPNETARRQMNERGWTEEDVMRKESISLDAAHKHVVPRLIERDKNGKMFVAMPVYSEDLSDRIDNLDLKQALTITRDIADALSYIHEQKEAVTEKDDYNPWVTERKKAHGDVKPSNILIKDGRAFLSDFGSSTCVSIGGHGSSRGPHGDENYRAPECFEENARPSSRADVWSLGAILYEAVTKQGIYDGVNPRDENLQELISRKLRKAPRKLRKFLRKCLAVDEYERFNTGAQALSELEKIIETLGAGKTIKDYARKFSVPIGLPLALTGLFIYSALTHEPTKLEIPKAYVQGQLYLDKNPNESFIKFDLEDINNLPKTYQDINVDETSIKMSTDNRYAAALLKSYMQAVKSLGALRNDIFNKAQTEIWAAYASRDERSFPTINTNFAIPAKSIEVALTKSVNPDGSVDLEDTLAIARLGEDKVNQARKTSGSFDYKNYITAKDSKGNYIINKKEQRFLKYWLAYTYELFR